MNPYVPQKGPTQPRAGPPKPGLQNRYPVPSSLIKDAGPSNGDTSNIKKPINFPPMDSGSPFKGEQQEPSKGSTVNRMEREDDEFSHQNDQNQEIESSVNIGDVTEKGNDDDPEQEDPQNCIYRMICVISRSRDMNLRLSSKRYEFQTHEEFEIRDIQTTVEDDKTQPESFEPSTNAHVRNEEYTEIVLKLRNMELTLEKERQHRSFLQKELNSQKEEVSNYRIENAKLKDQVDILTKKSKKSPDDRLKEELEQALRERDDYIEAYQDLKKEVEKLQDQYSQGHEMWTLVNTNLEQEVQRQREENEAIRNGQNEVLQVLEEQYKNVISNLEFSLATYEKVTHELRQTIEAKDKKIIALENRSECEELKPLIEKLKQKIHQLEASQQEEKQTQLHQIVQPPVQHQSHHISQQVPVHQQPSLQPQAHPISSQPIFQHTPPIEKFIPKPQIREIPNPLQPKKMLPDLTTSIENSMKEPFKSQTADPSVASERRIPEVSSQVLPEGTTLVLDGQQEPSIHPENKLENKPPLQVQEVESKPPMLVAHIESKPQVQVESKPQEPERPPVTQIPKPVVKPGLPQTMPGGPGGPGGMKGREPPRKPMPGSNTATVKIFKPNIQQASPEQESKLERKESNPDYDKPADDEKPPKMIQIQKTPGRSGNQFKFV